MVTLKKEYDFYKLHKEELLKKYENKVVVICNQQVIGVFDDKNTAIDATEKQHPLGSFLVHWVKKKEKVGTVPRAFLPASNNKQK